MHYELRGQPSCARIDAILNVITHQELQPFFDKLRVFALLQPWRK